MGRSWRLRGFSTALRRAILRPTSKSCVAVTTPSRSRASHAPSPPRSSACRKTRSRCGGPSTTPRCAPRPRSMRRRSPSSSGRSRRASSSPRRDTAADLVKKAEDTAERLRQEATDDAARMRAEASADAVATRAAAREDARQLRAETMEHRRDARRAVPPSRPRLRPDRRAAARPRDPHRGAHQRRQHLQPAGRRPRLDLRRSGQLRQPRSVGRGSRRRLRSGCGAPGDQGAGRHAAGAGVGRRARLRSLPRSSRSRTSRSSSSTGPSRPPGTPAGATARGTGPSAAERDQPRRPCATSSTRSLAARPAGVVLSPIGSVSPRPCT